MPSRIEEICEGSLSPRELTEELAIRKVNRAITVFRGQNPPWICGADTVIFIDGEILGKPKDREEARNMLIRLRGREHGVVTAVALYNDRNKGIDCRSVTSGVTFASLSAREIEWYLDTGEWQGAAGSYRIQGLASCFIQEVRGSCSAIAGLPIREFYVMLRENGYPYGTVTVS
jgi:septum formation protein